MAKDKAFSPEKYSVLITHKDLVRLLETERHMKRIEERSAAMQ